MTHRLFLTLTSLFFLCASAFSEPPAPIEPDFSGSVVAQLRGGEVVLFQPADALGQAGAAVQIHATRDEIWEVILDWESAPSYMPTLKTAKLLKSKGNTQLVAHHVKIGFMPAVSYQFLATQTPKKAINFRQTEGDLRDFAGGWLLVDGAEFDQPGSFFVFYQVYLDPGRLVPQSMVQRSLIKDVPPVLTNIRKRIYDLQVESAAKVASR